MVIFAKTSTNAPHQDIVATEMQVALTLTVVTTVNVTMVSSVMDILAAMLMSVTKMYARLILIASIPSVPINALVLTVTLKQPMENVLTLMNA